ncbi:hypothetical protein ACOSP7_017923 [Xanthoceras sorbifolium]|uniref:t-SNARE coiled-coil homology domain-containing protein n=1 Tax=Xanthoceras sorbifolium TaxID=99658 RepID=A0ABQ8I073_9ROSI|nr:hypothetical protein JRO89_XS05G0032100 [Xanthoceras sorbifolium]
MFGFKKAPANVTKQKSVDPPGSSKDNPFDSDDESDVKPTRNPAKRTSSEPGLLTQHMNDKDPDGLENKTVQELEQYAVSKAQDTTSSVNNCLRIAENIKEDATKTLDMLHQQGEQIHRTHVMATDMDKDLSKGEKLLNSLGGMFSKPWKPKKTRAIDGPKITPDSSSRNSENSKEQREKLGLGKGHSGSQTPTPEPTNAMQKVEVEKAKQDDALSDLSNILGDLKGMAVDMGSELERQNKALDHLGDDVDELNSRVKGANQRARHLLGK